MTTYSISLDDIDLTLLPTRSYSNNFLKKDLFEFQLLAGPEKEDHPVYPSYLCHICAIDVPAPFLHEHIASAKHQANVRIATEASRRMRALIAATPPPLTPRATEQFCDSCTRIVGKDHEKTKEHRVSAIQDRMLCDLAYVYIGDDNEVKKHLQKDEDKLITKDITKVDCNIENLTNTSLTETGQKQKAFKLKETNDKLTTKEEMYGHCTEFVKLNLAMYIKILIKATSSPKIDIRPVGEKIYILINDERMIVSYENFNSYIRMEGTLKVHCHLCDKSFDEVHEEVHKLTVAHVTSVMPIVGDSHCIREMHNWWSHCILCNEIVWSSDVEAHKRTQRHINEKREATVPPLQINTVQDKNTNPLAKIPEDKYKNTAVTNQNLLQNALEKQPAVKPKNIMLPNQDLQTRPAINISELYAQNKIVPSANTPQTAAGKKAKPKAGKKKKIPKENQETIISYVYVDSKDDINYPYIKESNGDVRCVICDCVVPSYYANRIAHLNGNRHAINLNKQFPALEQNA